jgi:hypothetical protein
MPLEGLARTNEELGCLRLDRRPRWMKLRRTQCEQTSSGLLLKADMARYSRHFAFVPEAEVNSRHASEISTISATKTAGRRTASHSGIPAIRNPSASLATSASRRNGCLSRMSEIRCVGSIFITLEQASLASSTRPHIAWQAIAIL